jgi:hypothetical protein
VLDALITRPGSDPAGLVTLAYDDTPSQAHGIAQRSLLAHLEKLREDGRVFAEGDVWYPQLSD